MPVLKYKSKTITPLSPPRSPSSRSLPLQMSPGWLDLPQEMSLSILELLSLDDVKAFSLVSRPCRSQAMSTLFKVRLSLRDLVIACIYLPFQSVKLDCYEQVEAFVSRFPTACRTYIRSLHVSMRPNQVANECDYASSQTDLLVILLSTCMMIQSLTLYVFGSPQKHIIPPFARLGHLTSLSIGNDAPEQLMPL